MYATPAELASFLKQDVDTSSATLALQVASERFCKAANTRFESTAVTYQSEGSYQGHLVLPFAPIIAVLAVRVGGVTVTDYTRIDQILYRAARWGGQTFPPTLVEVDLTHGFTSAGDDVKGVVLETAATAYQSPDPSTVSESIDDYSIRTAPNIGGIMLTPSAEKLAEWYRGAFAA